MENMERLGEGRWYYRNLFLLGSLLSAGNIIDYFIFHTEKLVIIYFLPRWEKRNNFIEVYHQGKLENRYELFSPKFIFFQYPVFFLQCVTSFFFCFKKNEHFFVITYHPLLFFFKSIIGIFRNYTIVFWIADYFPKTNFFLGIYQSLIFFFHARNTCNIYLTDRINSVMNNGILQNTEQSKTIMWGVSKPLEYKTFLPKKQIKLFYHGVIREEHGLDLLFDVLHDMDFVQVKILGKCDAILYKKYKRILEEKKITGRVYFPNRFFPLKELEQEAKDCFIAVAPYRISPDSFTFYADPGKVKIYAQFGLPIIITGDSEIAGYIKKWKAGEVINWNKDALTVAIKKIYSHYSVYMQGIKKFNNFFGAETYYRQRFSFLENDYDR